MKMDMKSGDSETEWSGLMGKMTWQMIWEILERYEGQTKSVTAMEIVRVFNQNQPTPVDELGEHRSIEPWKQ